MLSTNPENQSADNLPTYSNGKLSNTRVCLVHFGNGYRTPLVHQVQLFSGDLSIMEASLEHIQQKSAEWPTSQGGSLPDRQYIGKYEFDPSRLFNAKSFFY